MTTTPMIFLWSWFRNHPFATFQEFSDAFERCKKIIERNTPSCDDRLE